MKSILNTLSALLLVLPFTAAHAQVADTPRSCCGALVADLQDNANNLRPSFTGEWLVAGGATALAAGFAVSAVAASQENASRALTVTGGTLLVGGFATAAAGLGVITTRSLPAYRVGYCERYAGPETTRTYIRSIAVAKAAGIAGTALCAASLGITLAEPALNLPAAWSDRANVMGLAGVAFMGAGLVMAIFSDNAYYIRARSGAAQLTAGLQEHGAGLALVF